MIGFEGQFLSEGAPELSLLNRSFRYGDGLFETIRIYEGRMLFFPLHMERLNRGMNLLGFGYSPSEWNARLQQACADLINQARLSQHGRLRLHVFRSGPGAYTPVDDTPHFLLEAYSLKYDPYQDPFAPNVTLFEDFRLTHSPLSACKTANSLPYILAGKYAKSAGVDEAIMLNGEGWIAEASSANLFWVKGKKLFTPPLETGCLDGVLRKTLIQVAGAVQMPFQEKKIRVKELREADEILLTNTIRGIQPVAKVDQTAFPGRKGPMGAFLQNCLIQYVKEGL